MEKINIYVPGNIGKILENDAILFEIYKNDRKTINKNRFLGSIVQGYYEEYAAEAKSAFDRILTEIDTKAMGTKEKEVLAGNILRNVVLPAVPPRKERNSIRLSLKPTKDTEILIEQIIQDLGATDYISQYFCRMLMSYCGQPIWKREQILFKRNYDQLMALCTSGHCVTFRTIWNDDTIHKVIPYRVVTGSEEMYNYLLCSEIDPSTGEQEPMTYRLNRIHHIYRGKEMRLLDPGVQRYLDMMIRYGPQYQINDDEEVCVKLSASGVKSFSRIYFGRPNVDRIEEKDGSSLYFFKGSKNQVFLYFRRFNGAEAEILSPLWLREKMISFHKESVDAYLSERGNENG